MDGQELHFQGLRIVYSQELSSNLVRLPNKICRLLDQSDIPVQEFGIKINADVDVGWDGQTSKSFRGTDQTLEMNAILAGEYKLQMGQLVDISIKRYDSSSFVTEVHIEPKGFQDWETIESNAAFFQDQILYQTRLVRKGAHLLCFMRNVVCKFSIKSMMPDHLEVGRLTNDTLVIVEPKLREEVEANEDLVVDNSQKLVKRTLLDNGDLSGVSIALKTREYKYEYATVSVIRAPFEEDKSKGKTKSGGGSSSTTSSVPSSIGMGMGICCKVYEDDSLRDESVKMSEMLRKALQLPANNGYKVRVSYVKKLPKTPFDVVICPHGSGSSGTEGEEDSTTTVDEYFNCIKKLDILSDNLLVQDRDLDLKFTVKLRDGKGSPVPFGKCPADVSKVKVSERTNIALDVGLDRTSSPLKLIGFEKTYSEILDTVRAPLAKSSSFLVQGGAGMGKTLVLQNLAFDLINDGYHVQYVDGDAVPDSTNLAKTKQYLSELVHSAYWHMPSAILFDNADSLFTAAKSADDQPSSGNSRGLYSQTSTKLTQMFMSDVQRTMDVAAGGSGSGSGVEVEIKVVFGAKSQESLNKMLFQKQFVGDTWTLKPPTRYQRNDILQWLLSEKSIELAGDTSVTELSLETEGYSPADLALLVDRLFYEVVSRDQDHENRRSSSLLPLSPSPLTRAMVESCVSQFTPASLRSVKLQKGTGVKWSDIGGLREAKRLLLETLEWPNKYAPIFARSPLRLRSGILLYGYPGCGKTMLASAVAQQCGLNFISVKGPEILNKYIGASEQSVRELFERAQAAKPCILFFDEFDSIAPKRGHDSTGVTDRVVNQLLTQMDGAEGLDGVYVLAATSRPDLIDSALLRPGRLDKSVLCDVPDEEERAEILRAITRGKMALDASCDVGAVARLARGFTGADLQGVVNNAYLKAVHRTLGEDHPGDHSGDHSGVQDAPQNDASQGDTRPPYICLGKRKPLDGETLERIGGKLKQLGISISNGNGNGNGNGSASGRTSGIVVSAEDLEAACLDAKPSISRQELEKLTAVYRKFIGDREGKMPSGEASQKVGGRTTLA